MILNGCLLWLSCQRFFFEQHNLQTAHWGKSIGLIRLMHCFCTAKTVFFQHHFATASWSCFMFLFFQPVNQIVKSLNVVCSLVHLRLSPAADAWDIQQWMAMGEESQPLHHGKQCGKTQQITQYSIYFALFSLWPSKFWLQNMMKPSSVVCPAVPASNHQTLTNSLPSIWITATQPVFHKTSDLTIYNIVKLRVEVKSAII